jgi:hypothetical protein
VPDTDQDFGRVSLGSPLGALAFKLVAVEDAAMLSKISGRFARHKTATVGRSIRTTTAEPVVVSAIGRCSTGSDDESNCQSNMLWGLFGGPQNGFPQTQPTTPPTTKPTGLATTKPVPAPKAAPTVSACELVGATAIMKTATAANKVMRIVHPFVSDRRLPRAPALNVANRGRLP